MKKIFPLILIYVIALIGWMILGSVTSFRSYSQDDKLKQRVGGLWGASQDQEAPEIFYEEKKLKSVKERDEETGRMEARTVETTEQFGINLESTDLKADFNLDYRKKGLLWYSTYKVKIAGEYGFINTAGKNTDINFVYKFPSSSGVYDDFLITVNGKKYENVRPKDGRVSVKLPMKSGEKASVAVSYVSQGMDSWWYSFGSSVTNVKNFNLVMTTDFDKIDFPERAMSPSSKKKTDKGWELSWNYKNLLSGINIGLEMPKKLNPGPFASQVSFFAPVSLFFFFFLMFIITAIKGIKIHPMNYFFLAAAFFSFHLMLSYLADVVNIYIAFGIASAVSIFLVISYMRLVVGNKFAYFETGLSQFVYLVLFSAAFFLQGYTGLTITALVVVTLFVVMQFTAKVDWEKQFKSDK